MKIMSIVTALTIGAGLFISNADAGTIDFAAYANNQEGGIENRSAITFASGDTIRFYVGNGLNLNRPGQPDLFPYFDDENAGKPAGLGVCRVLDGAAGIGAPGAECLDSSDDSIDGENGITESLWLEFVDGPYNIRGLSFRDGDHNDLNNSDGLVQWGATTATHSFGGINSFAELVAMAIAGDLDGVKFFGLAYVDTEFYLSAVSDVPIPGAIPLLLSGLAGLGVFARRTKKKGVKIAGT